MSVVPPNPQKMTRAEIRVELAKRVRSARAVSHYNDPKREYRRKMNDCRKGIECYHRSTGFPWAAKEV